MKGGNFVFPFAHPVLFEDLDELREIGQRTGEAVDLVDDDHLHPALPDLREKAAEGPDARAKRPIARHRHSDRATSASPHGLGF
jgi:hypothetical protein